MLSAATGAARDSVTDVSDTSEVSEVSEVSDAEFLDAMAALAGGVCVVTTADPDGEPAGFTGTAVMSLSRSPQLIAIGVDESSRTLPVLLRRRAFALNVLHAGAESVARRFADPRADRFAGLDGLTWTTGGQPLPLLLGHSSYALTCRVTQDVRAGDHRLVIAAVERLLPGTGGTSGTGVTGALVHVGRRYHPLEAA